MDKALAPQLADGYGWIRAFTHGYGWIRVFICGLKWIMPNLLSNPYHKQEKNVRRKKDEH